MISEITPEQRAKIPEYFAKWNSIAKDYSPITEKDYGILRKYLAHANITAKNIIVLDSPYACMQEISKKEGNTIRFYDMTYWYTSGNTVSGYCAFYDYVNDNLIKLNKKTNTLFQDFLAFCSRFHYIFVFEEVVFCSQKPVELHFAGTNLHNDNGPAVRYADNYSLYCMNGVTVPEWLPMTPKNDLDPKKVISIVNAEQRKEGLRKIGFKRLESFGTILDQVESYNYKLIDMRGIIGIDEPCPYLFMDNPSTGDRHAEPVHEDCKTVQDAINYRAGDITKIWAPISLS